MEGGGGGRTKAGEKGEGVGVERRREMGEGEEHYIKLSLVVVIPASRLNAIHSHSTNSRVEQTYQPTTHFSLLPTPTEVPSDKITLQRYCIPQVALGIRSN